MKGSGVASDSFQGGVTLPSFPVDMWTDVVITFDEGDFMQSAGIGNPNAAHVTLYINGQNVETNAAGNPTPGSAAMYDSFVCTYQQACGSNGLCPSGQTCQPNDMCAIAGECPPPEGDRWKIDPLNGTGELRIGTEEEDVYFKGKLDEFAIFPYALSASDAANLSSWAH